jgi:dTDP-4-amino-4,6-dideoxygalactose transaminase
MHNEYLKDSIQVGPLDPPQEDLDGEDLVPEDNDGSDFKKFTPRPGTFLIPLIDLNKQYKDLVDEISTQLANLIFMGEFVGGGFLEQFENNFAGYHSVRNCVGVGSGTDALWLTLLALDIGPGDEVIVPTHTFVASALAVSHCGANVRFVDRDPETYTIDAESMEEAINTRTRAIIPVHIYGQACDMTAIMNIANDRNIPVVEDCAQAVGATWKGQRVGSFGKAGCYSFYPTKNLGGLGQGGAVVTDDLRLAKTVRSLGNVGRAEDSHVDFAYKGFNSRLDTLNAMFLKRCLSRLQSWNYERQASAFLYDEQLGDFGAIKTPFVNTNATHVYHLYVIKCLNTRDRDGLKEFLTKNKIGTGIYYPKPIHLLEIYKREGGSYFPVAEDLAETSLALPMHPNLTEEEVDYIVGKIKKYFS